MITDENAMKLMKESLDSRLDFTYSFWDYNIAKLLQSCCCCFKKFQCFQKHKKRLQRFEEAEEKLNKETDFFRFIKLLRVTHFMAKIKLRKY